MSALHSGQGTQEMKRVFRENSKYTVVDLPTRTGNTYYCHSEWRTVQAGRCRKLK